MRVAGPGTIQGVLIDVTRLVLRRLRRLRATGIDRVGLAYVQRYQGHARAVLVHRGHSRVLQPGHSQALFAWLLDAEAPVWAKAGALLWWLARAERAGGLAGEWLLHTGHRGLDHAGYAQDLRRRGVRPVFLIHDLIPITHPEYCRQGEDQMHARRMRHAIELGHGLIANSQATLASLREHARAQGLGLPPTVMAPLAPSVAPVAEQGGQAPLAGAYFVALGTIEPRKNHLLLLQVWRQWREQASAGIAKLVLIGRRGWECQETLNLLQRTPSLRDCVVWCPDCTDAQLTAWLRHARALLFPTFVEGYGLPAVEAISLGVPVIASDLAVFRESVADIPDYLHPLDGLAWLETVQHYATAHSPHRQAQLERMRAFTPPSWGQHHEVVERFLARLSAPAMPEHA